MIVSDYLPERIGPYVIQAEVGAGAHGRVYRAHHKDRPNVTVAVKVIADRGNRDRLLLEPELLARLHHPGIVRLLDYFIDEPNLVVVLEYVDGETLEALLQREGPQSASAVRRMLAQVTDALHHAHEKNILHRDIKLSNIMVTGPADRRRFVLTDFGISRLSQGIQSSRQTAGTWFFMSPEQLRGRPVKQSDLWSLGVVAYRLLTGRYPFEGNSHEELCHAILYQDPADIRRFAPEFDDETLQTIVLDLLAKQLTERLYAADDLLHRLNVDTTQNETAKMQRNGSHPDLPTAATLRQKELRQIRKTWITFWLGAVLMVAPFGPVLGSLGLVTTLVFYFGYVCRKQTVRRILLPLAVILSLVTISYTMGVGPPNYLGAVLDDSPETQQMAAQGYQYLCGFYYLIVAPAVIHFFTKARRLRRDLQRRSLLPGTAQDAESGLVQLRTLLAWHPQDLQLQVRYASSLLAAGQVSDAAVEAQLVLENDPWNFAANLLLAQCWFDLNRWDECRAVCERNLVASGQCFEFSDLRNQCLLYT
ncbi:MAG: protein kinase [Planctomycetaceae bacterium]